MNKGFVIMAQNSDTVDYVKCAEKLRDSILHYMPQSQVTIITEGEPGFATDWQVYNNSPYEYTIKLEADMVITSDISYWWDILKDHDIVVSSAIRDYKGELSECRVYRKFIDDNNLPDVYNAITYFKKSAKAEEFYNTVRNIFENWEDYKKILKCDSDEPATTDWVYSIACNIIGTELTTLPTFTEMSMVHMKRFVNNLMSEDWTKELIIELLPDTIRVNGFPQRHPFHYHVKDFSKVLDGYY